MNESEVKKRKQKNFNGMLFFSVDVAVFHDSTQHK